MLNKDSLTAASFEMSDNKIISQEGTAFESELPFKFGLCGVMTSVV